MRSSNTETPGKLNLRDRTKHDDCVNKETLPGTRASSITTENILDRMQASIGSLLHNRREKVFTSLYVDTEHSNLHKP